MGSGKTTVAGKLAARLGWEWLDLDDLISRRAGSSIEDFWELRGEEEFRDMEQHAVGDVAGDPRRVIATGGGVVVRPGNIAEMRASGLVVWLQANPASLARRLGTDRTRPLLHHGDRLVTLTDLLAARQDAYQSAAHMSVATDDLHIATIVDRIEELWNEFE